MTISEVRSQERATYFGEVEVDIKCTLPTFVYCLIVRVLYLNIILTFLSSISKYTYTTSSCVVSKVRYKALRSDLIQWH